MTYVNNIWKRWWFWIFATLMIYLVGSWFLVPWGVEHSLEDFSRQRLELTFRAESLSFNPFTFVVTVSNARFDDRARTVLQFDRLSVDFEPFRSLLSWQFVFDTVELFRPTILVLRDENALNWTEIVSRTSRPESSSDGLASSFSLGKFLLRDGTINWEDTAGSPPVRIQVRSLQGAANDLHFPSRDTSPVRLEGRIGEGNFSTKGKWFSETNELSAQYELREVPLHQAAGHLSRRRPVRMKTGRLSSKGQVHLDLTGVSLETSGKALVTNLDLQTEETDLLSFKAMHVREFKVRWPQRIARVGQVFVEKPFLDLNIYTGYRTNLESIMTSNSTVTSEPKKPQLVEPWTLAAGPIKIREGTLNFRDENVPGGFQSHVQDLGGTVATLQRGKSTPVNLTGRVSREGRLEINGQFNLFSSPRRVDLNLRFMNVPLAQYTPYAVKFAGYQIEQGQLRLQLQYTLEGDQLSGRHHAVLEQFELGEKVNETPVLSLPIKLAIALLTDSNGVIELDIPVTGNINDPQFSFATVIRSAVTNTLGNIVSSPFRFLAGLVGSEAEELQAIEFPAGKDHLSRIETEDVRKLKEALLQRPELRIAIRPTWSPVDREVLAENRVDEQLREAGGNPENLVDSRSSLERLYREAFSSDELDRSQARHTKDEELREKSYVEELYRQLVTDRDIPETHLTELAQRRAQNVRDAIRSEEVNGERLLLLEVVREDSENGIVSLPFSLRP